MVEAVGLCRRCYDGGATSPPLDAVKCSTGGVLFVLRAMAVCRVRESAL